MPSSSTPRDVPATRRRVWWRAVLLLFALLWIGTAVWQTNKPLPPGLHVNGPWYPVAARDVAFIADVTSADAYGRPIVSQAIFDEVLRVVHSARRFIVLDYFLFGGRPAAADGTGASLRPIAAELREALIERRRVQPDLRILLITDPASEMYGDEPARDLLLLQAAGVDVAVTDLGRLRDSNFLYSSLWRIAVGWWRGAPRRPGPAARSGWLPNPLAASDAPITLGAWMRVLNFKANQRSVVLADDGRGGLVAVVGSASPYDAGTTQSNAALRVTGPATWPLLESELAIARFSGWTGELGAAVKETVAAAAVAGAPSAASAGSGEAAGERIPPAVAPENRARVLTEGAIRLALLEQLEACGRGASVDIAMLYLADRGIVEALLAASRRGATVRLVLDPNKDAYGRPRAGIPNQPVAGELVAASDGAIHVRWYRTHGEQFHSKLVMVYGAERLWLLVGSANLTRRNLQDYDLEADVAMDLGRNSPIALQMLDYFDTLWNNRAPLGIEYTADFGFYADPSQFHYWWYRLLEDTGVWTF